MSTLLTRLKEQDGTQTSNHVKALHGKKKKKKKNMHSRESQVTLLEEKTLFCLFLCRFFLKLTFFI